VFSVRGPCSTYVRKRKDCSTGFVKKYIRDLNLEVVKLATVQVTRLPLWHKIRKIGMICSAKPILTETLCVFQKEEFSIACYMCEMYT
jgi:hypothetical protein